MGLYSLKDLRKPQSLSRRDTRFLEKPRWEADPIPSQEQFARMVLRERKRTDRSGKPFLLMLLDIEKSTGIDAREDLMTRISQSVASSIRDTDVQGWHRNKSVLGILFTELNLDGPVPVTEVIQTKILSGLALRLKPEELRRISVRLHMYPDNWSSDNKAPLNSALYPDLVEIQGQRKWSLMLKRAVDIVGSLIALVILLPILGLIAVLIRLTSPGPIFFRQIRIGRYGQRFTFFKFRTMYSESSESVHQKYVQQLIADTGERETDGDGNGAVYKIQDDPRITPIGRFFRKTSLDELPQFWNVLKGDMSIVGPRPPIPYEVECYEVWHRRRLFEVKPGITGLWQVCGRSRTRFNEMVRLDLQYAKSWSLWLDLRILLRTPGAVISGDGAY